MQPMFDAPDQEDLVEIIIDAAVVRGDKKPIEKKKSNKKVA
jgi:ATP-dependent protease Clp ATPase subunit